MGFSDVLRQAEEDVRKVSSRHEKARREAEGEVRRAEKAQEERVRDIEKRMRSIEKKTTCSVAFFNGIHLYANRVAYADTKLSLDASLKAAVDIRGGIYPGGRSGLPRDYRKMFIVIESHTGSILRECDPDDEKKARDFVALVKATAAKAGKVKADASRQLAELQVELDKEKANTSEIEAAKAALEAVESDTGEIDEARKALEELRSKVPQEELAAYNEEKIRYGRKILAGLLIAAIVLIAIVLAVVLS